MAVFLLTWNPDGNGWPDYQDWAEGMAGGPPRASNWSVGGRKSGISVGDRAFLMRQRHERGLVASGTFTSEIYVDDHWEIRGATARSANLDWECVLPIEDGLPVKDLKAAVPGVIWDRLQGSGVRSGNLMPKPSKTSGKSMCRRPPTERLASTRRAHSRRAQ